MKLLFYVSKLYSIPVIQPLVSEAAGRNARVAFFVSSKVMKQLPDAFSEFEIFTELKDAITFNPDFVLCPGNFVDFRLPGIKVELFHGIGIEKPSHYRIRHFFDLYLTSGPVVTEHFKEMGKKYEYFRTVETGWPKIDHILNYDTTHIKERFNIPCNKKIILFAPTHSKTMESASAILPKIETNFEGNKGKIKAVKKTSGSKTKTKKLLAIGKYRLRGFKEDKWVKKNRLAIASRSDNF